MIRYGCSPSSWVQQLEQYEVLIIKLVCFNALIKNDAIEIKDKPESMG